MSDETRFLGALCEALSKWCYSGDCLAEVCAAFTSGVQGVRWCWAVAAGESDPHPKNIYCPGGDCSTEDLSNGNVPEQVSAAFPDFAASVLRFGGSPGDLTIADVAGGALYGMSAVAGKNCRIGLIAFIAPSSARCSPDHIGSSMSLALRLVSQAFSSRDAAEHEMEERVFTRLRDTRAEMLSTMSHEMRTPLSSIKGFATSLLRTDVEWDQGTQREFLGIINEEADKLEKMASSVLDLAAIEAGGMVLEKSPVLLPRLVSRVVSTIGARSESHRFVVDFPAEFPIVLADPFRIEQILYNLIDNAVKYSREGGLIVTTGKTNGREVIISVTDQGKGIPAEHLNRLFEKFFRAKGSKQVGGIGLGLPISRRIVEAHSGRIWAESFEGRGTTVHFTLPIDAEAGGGR